MKGGSKYQPLLEYLRQSNQREVTLSFAQIELVMNHTLPNSARSKRAWWSNRTKGALQASAWMEAGYIVAELDMEGESVTFRKSSTQYTVQRTENIVQQETVMWNSDMVKAMRQHLGLSQAELATQLGVRQQTISEWENAVYPPSRSTSKHLSRVAEQLGFKYRTDS